MGGQRIAPVGTHGPNYEEILLYKKLCKENPFMHPIHIYYTAPPERTIQASCASGTEGRSRRYLVESNGEATELTILSQVNCILNKLSISNFDKLSSELLKIEIISDNLLEKIVKSIFNKAIAEPHFGEIYSKLCLCFGNFNIQFKRFLLDMCQSEFEKRSELRQSRGNIVFIGQLFKAQMISEQIIHSCLGKLIDEPNEENIECICKLLEITGSKMKENIDENFRKLKSISENKLVVDPRHRFMIKDLIELRQNNWASRKTNQPLKMI